MQNQRTLKAYAIKVDDKVFDAQLTLNKRGEIGYHTLENQGVKPVVNNVLADCPLCNGKVIETAKAYGCSEWRNGCKMTIWKTIAQQQITIALAKKLLSSGETGVLTGFKSSKNTEFSANLKLVNGKVEMDFSE
ncbi:MAG: DNA topoisomerase III [Methylococcaceae bacterium NSP1-2]|nr:topoisomerase C-terminal repeat-containing protein [Methylococcaceae bacterium]OYV16434.1 MAG: DNA topoisomerase III [Methylococcaceae bacterium NSP1-2]